MGKKAVKDIKTPKKPVVLSLAEMESIINLSKQKMSQKNIAKTITKRRSEEGITKKLSTNTVSRILTKTDQKPGKGIPAKGKYYQAQIKEAQRKYDHRIDQKVDWEHTRGRIKDEKKRDMFDRAYKKIIEKSAGRRHKLKSGYDAETDEIYFETV